MLIFMSAFWYV